MRKVKFPYEINPVHKTYNLLSTNIEFDLNKLINLGMDETFKFGIHGYNILGRESWPPDITAMSVRSYSNLRAGRFMQ